MQLPLVMTGAEIFEFLDIGGEKSERIDRNGERKNPRNSTGVRRDLHHRLSIVFSRVLERRV